MTFGCPCGPCRLSRRARCVLWGATTVAGILVYAVPMAILLALGFPRRVRPEFYDGDDPPSGGRPRTVT